MAEHFLYADLVEDGDLKFVEWEGGEGQEKARDEETTTKGKAPRLHHKKSRKGCQQCRDRRVKVCCLIFEPELSSLSLCFWNIMILY